MRLLLAAIEYWSAYGLRLDVLKDICRHVFKLEVDWNCGTGVHQTGSGSETRR